MNPNYTCRIGFCDWILERDDIGVWVGWCVHYTFKHGDMYLFLEHAHFLLYSITNLEVKLLYLPVNY